MIGPAFPRAPTPAPGRGGKHASGWFSQAIEHGTAAARQRLSARAEIAEQVIEQPASILVVHFGAPADHLVELSIPLSPGETLLANDVVIVADNAPSRKVGRAVAGRRLGVAPARRVGKRFHDVDADAWHDVPAITRWIPLLIKWLCVARRVPCPRQDTCSTPPESASSYIPTAASRTGSADRASETPTSSCVPHRR